VPCCIIWFWKKNVSKSSRENTKASVCLLISEIFQNIEAFISPRSTTKAPPFLKGFINDYVWSIGLWNDFLHRSNGYQGANKIGWGTVGVIKVEALPCAAPVQESFNRIVG